MTEDSSAKVSSDEATVNTDVSQSRKRKKRKWDQPAELVVSAGVLVSGVVPLGNVGSLPGISHPGVASVSGSLLTNPHVASCATIPPVLPVPSIAQNSAMVVPKLNQPKIQDELIIAREIVINDAESSVRCKLTKRQTQEEIQKCTGAVVITRGKYRPPNAPPDGEKPLYLHISAGAHLKDTAERILAVDQAAAMVDEMLKQGQSLQPSSSIFQPVTGNGMKALSTCVFLGFSADTSLNIAARIRGPNDQYINHIMNETGATVVLRGHGSGNIESTNSGEIQQPLHLFLSASNSKSLEDAKRLAENLLDTISLECRSSRVSSSNVYKAVPPPPLLAGVQSSVNEHKVYTSPTSGLTSSRSNSTPLIPAPSVTIPVVTTIFSQGMTSQSPGMGNCGQPQPKVVGYPQPLVTLGTSYSGYGGIYPQATPLQQVALALRQSSSPITSTVSPTTSVESTATKPSTTSVSDKDKRPTQRRKFQELPIGSKGSVTPHQESEFLKPGQELPADLGVRNISTMPPPRKLAQTSSNGMPPPPPRTLPPPPPPKFTASTLSTKLHDQNKIKSDTVPDTLVKLMEYGEEDDDPDENSEESPSPLNGSTSAVAVRKPFWAL